MVAVELSLELIGRKLTGDWEKFGHKFLDLCKVVLDLKLFGRRVVGVRKVAGKDLSWEI